MPRGVYDRSKTKPERLIERLKALTAEIEAELTEAEKLREVLEVAMGKTVR